MASHLTRRQFISPEEAKRIKRIAFDISSKMAICGPIQTECCGNIKKTHTIISGFNDDRASGIIEDSIIRYLLDDEYGKTI